MQLDWKIILNSSIGAAIIIICRELIIRYFDDRIKYGKANKRKIADDLLLYCSRAEAKDYTPPYEKDKEIYLLNSIAGINKEYGYTFKDLTSLLSYNELADALNEEKEFDYKDKKDVVRKIKKLLLELKKISYRLRR